MRDARLRHCVLALAVALPIVAACTADRERTSAERFEPLRYDYLPPIRLNVAAISVEQRYVPASTGDDLTKLDPVAPADAIRAMAEDRLKPLGTTGRAVLAINDATVARAADGLEGSADVRLDIYGPSDERVAFADARVSARRAGDGGGQRRGLYELTKALVDQLNVELEYQVRHNLRDWVVTAQDALPAPVQQRDLPAPAR